MFQRRTASSAICTGWTRNCVASWISVRSPRIASIATRTLNFGEYCLRVVVNASSCDRRLRN